MCDPVTIGIAGLALGGASAIDGHERGRRATNETKRQNEEAAALNQKALDLQTKAATEANETSLAALATARDEAAKNADLADQAMNRANAKQPDIGKLRSILQPIICLQHRNKESLAKTARAQKEEIAFVHLL